MLKQAGLIHERREGTKRLYRARPEGLADLRAFENESVDVAPGASTGPREGLEPAVGLRGQRVIFTSGLRGR